MAITFNGSDSTLKHAGTTVTAYPFTIFCWARCTNIATAGGQSVVEIGVSTSDSSSLLLAGVDIAGDPMRVLSRFNGSLSGNSAASIVSGEWQPVMAVYSSESSRTIYFADGTSVTNTQSTPSNPSAYNAIAIGCRTFASGNIFVGDIAEVAVWSAALGSAEWNLLKAGASPSTVAAASLVEYWSLSTNAASIAGANGRTLTAVNTAQAASHPPVTGGTASVSLAGVGSTSAIGSHAISSDSAASLSLTGVVSTSAIGSAVITPTIPDSTYQVVANGSWTDTNSPRAVFYNGATYFGWANASGKSGITKYTHATGVSQNFSLSSFTQVDDHNTTAIHIRQDGRIVAFYSMHNDTSGARYRISTNPEDVTAWSAETILSASVVTYMNPRYLKDQGVLLFHHRSVDSTLMRHSLDEGATWSASHVFITPQSGKRPYAHSVLNGDRVDFIASDDHPALSMTSIYHFYAKWVGGAVKYYNSFGVELTTPFYVTAATKVYDGAAVRSMWQDIRADRNGKIRVLFFRWPTWETGSFCYTEFDGVKWTPYVEICSTGMYFDAIDPHSNGRGAFDTRNPDVLYLSRESGGAWNVEEWVARNSGASWQKSRDITTGAGKKFRPLSPEGHDGRAAVAYLTGEYVDFTDFNVSIRAAPSARVEIPLKTPAGALVTNQAGVRFAVLDTPALSQTSRMLSSGDDGATDSDGVFRAAAPGATGDVFLIVSDSDGDDEMQSNASAAPVAAVMP